MFVPPVAVAVAAIAIVNNVLGIGLAVAGERKLNKAVKSLDGNDRDDLLSDIVDLNMDAWSIEEGMTIVNQGKTKSWKEAKNTGTLMAKATHQPRLERWAMKMRFKA